jgi:sigma-B regulation protein RsbU (phosphoserine phosphatase)
MENTALPFFRDQLVDRRRRLEAASVTAEAALEAARLLQEIDAALDRLQRGTFGLCETCAGPIEADRLLADPLTRFCLGHLTRVEQRALEQDLELASRIQRELLPKPDVQVEGWTMAFRYQPAGAVSGDYCDVIPCDGRQAYFLVGDVAGKGVAAAMLMSHLSALLRTLISVGLPLDQLMERASRVFCESTLPTHYATLVCGHARASGEIDICNAGHPPPLVIRAGDIVPIEATGVPIGMFCSGQFTSRTIRLAPGEALLLYTDGLFEAQDSSGAEYGLERLSAVAAATAGRDPSAVVDACVRDVAAFRRAPSLHDDITVMAIRRL